MKTQNPRGTLPLIVRILFERGRLRRDDLESIREALSKESASVEEVLIRKGLATEHDVAVAYSNYLMVPLFEPPASGFSPDPQLARKLPEKLCRDHLLAPVAARNGTVEVVFFTPDALHIVDEIQLLTGLTVTPLIAPLSTVEGILGTLYEDSEWLDGGGAGADGTRFEEVDEGDEAGASATEDFLHLDQPPPPGRDGRIVRYVNQVFEQALRVGASDIHIEPFEDRCRVRLRVDGKLNEIAPPPQSLFTAIVSRIKVLSKMDIAEKRMPQDGAIALKTGEKRVDMRVNTVPTVHGEKVVLRLLDRGAIPLQLSDLGFDERQARDLTEAIEMPHGLMLVTGPTGSGKSTTLYACLNMLNKLDENICTVEDPVEYKFMGINQVQVKSQFGFTFASALRAFLRQDPDIIMVGEVRDAETAQICLRAALTGHFVLSTLHTNDALAAVDRLQDMGIEPFLLASTLRALVAQRLVRRLCPKCKTPYECGREIAARYGLAVGETIYRPGGCRECRDAGYRGRVGVFEVVRITGQIADLIQKRATLPELRGAATKEGMRLLGASALERVREGTTSLEEALSVSTDHGTESWDNVLDSIQDALAQV